MINVPYLTDLQRDIELTVRQALAEDLGHLPLEQGDITASFESQQANKPKPLLSAAKTAYFVAVPG